MKRLATPKIIYGYYAALLIVLLSWTSVNTAPNESIRIGFLMAVVAPGFIGNLNWMPSALICFFTISQYGYAYSYLPTTLSYYIYILIVGFLVSLRKRTNLITLKPPILIICFGFLVFFTDCIYSGTITYTLYCIIIICLLCAFTKKDDIDTLNKFELSFVIVSIVLSIMYIVMHKQFVIETFFYDGLERGSWTDLNYFGMITGFGSTISLMNLLAKRSNSKIEKSLYIVSLIVVLPALLLMASRGALLSVLTSYAVIIITSHASRKLKISFLCFAGVMIFILYTNDYFTLIQHRIESDDGTGSGRTTIWLTKINAFISEGSVLHYLFGYGHEGGLSLGTTKPFGFHNDFLAILVEYGFSGLFLFIGFFISIIRRTVNHIKNKVLGVSLYVLMCCLTLEPFTLGVLPFWLIILYLTSLANCKTNNNYE